MPSILITGASRGFGRELLDVYAQRNWTVFPLVRKPEVANELSREYAPRCFPIVGDVSLDSVEAAITDVLSKHCESLDILINNAGHIVKTRGMMDASPSDMTEHFDVHVIGPWRCTRASLPYLRKASRPVVVNITSRFGSITRIANRKSDFVYAYNIAKCGQNMLTACLDRDLRREGIRVLPIHPGRLKTEAAALDADTEPRVAAEKLYQWIERVNDTMPCVAYDLINDEVIEW